MLGFPTLRRTIKGILIALAKNWDDHVVHAEEVARSNGFRDLRSRILELAQPMAGDIVVDVGSGTGLLSLAIAERVEKVWAVDISQQMGEYIRVKAASAGLENVEPALASAVSLPLVDASADLVVSNYCLHHLADADKTRAISEIWRVLRPGGRLVLGDMMFRVGVGDPRNRRVLAQKVLALVRKGPGGFVRLAKNALRILTGRWERPASHEWWAGTLGDAGFVEIEVQLLDHEGGIAVGRRP